MKKYLIVGNWKMNPQTSEQAEALFNSIKQGIGDLQNTEVIICPPFVYLPILMRASAFAQGYRGLAFGSQNCFWEQEGPFTGEISPRMLKELGCQYVIVGHSERRQNLRETDEMINKKLKAALDAGLKPILCIGETEKQRKQGKTQKILESQLEIISRVPRSAFRVPQLIVAYEPVWSIGTGNACNADDAKQALSFLKQKCDEVGPRRIPILYGGSVDSKNAKDYIDVGFDGLLVGNASLNVKEFVKIVKTIDKV